MTTNLDELVEEAVEEAAREKDAKQRRSMHTNIQTRNPKQTALGVGSLGKASNGMAQQHHQQETARLDSPERPQQSYPQTRADTYPTPPPTELSRRHNIERNAVPQPGAVAIEGVDFEPTSVDIEDPPQQREDTDHMQDSQLAVANLVGTEDNGELPVARPETRGEDKADEAKVCKRNILLGSIALILTLMIFAAVFAQSKASSTKETDALSNSFGPEEENLSGDSAKIEEYLMALLPLETRIAIQQDGSPQARSFEWLLNDTQTLGLLSEERLVQRYALAVFYFAMGGSDSWQAEGWLNHSIHECLWETESHFSNKDGIANVYEGFLDGFMEPIPPKCNEEGIFEHLWVDQNNLEGVLPLELYLLTSLKSFSAISNGGLKGTLASLIGTLSRLEAIALTSTGVTGTVPTEIGLLSNTLQHFAAPFTGLSGKLPDNMFQLTKLSDLILTGSDLHGSISAQIGKFSNLRWLMIEDSGFSGTIPTEIGRATSLEWFLLRKSSVSGDIPTELGNLSQLRFFNSHFSMLGGTLPTELGRLTNLKNGFALRDCDYFGPIPSELGLLTNLIVSLNLRNNSFTGTIPTELGLLTNLHELELNNNYLTGQIPTEFGQLSTLGHLTLSNNSLWGPFPQEIKILGQSLHTITFEGNPLLSGTVPEGICNINGTCTAFVLDPCAPPFGVIFDCTDRLCGCGCSCESKN